MDTRSDLPNVEGSNLKKCIYCDNPATTKDHTPPKCLLRKPLPSNLITLPACEECNNGFSFEESVVRCLLALVGRHPLLLEERQPDGRINRVLTRDKRLRTIFDQCRMEDGNYKMTDTVIESFRKVFIKTVKGLFFGLYKRSILSKDMELLYIGCISEESIENVILRFQSSPLIDITDEPLSEIKSHSWHIREPIFLFSYALLSEELFTERAYRLKRETLLEWEDFQPGIFRFTFFRHKDGRAVCIMDLWDSLAVAVATPWPDSRGPLRKGRSNPSSRE